MDVAGWEDHPPVRSSQPSKMSAAATASRTRTAWRQRVRPPPHRAVVSAPPIFAPTISLVPVEPMPVRLNQRFPGLRQIHDDPPIFVIVGFLSGEACDALVKCATPHFRPSGMAFGGKEAAANVRTSSTVLLRRDRTEAAPLLSAITRLLGKPPSHCEDVQCSRYNTGEYYRSHFDGPGPEEGEVHRQFNACGGQRLATVLVYLNSVAVGGETAFPTLRDGAGLRISPERGRALLFFPGHADGTIDTRLMHEALPAGATKYVSQVWVRHGVDRFGLFMDTAESK